MKNVSYKENGEILTDEDDETEILP